MPRLTGGGSLKKVDEFQLDIDGRKVAVELHMYKDNVGAESLLARNKEYGIEIVDTDVMRLRQRVVDELLLQKHADWVPYMLIEVTGAFGGGHKESTLRVATEFWVKGTYKGRTVYAALRRDSVDLEKPWDGTFDRTQIRHHFRDEPPHEGKEYDGSVREGRAFVPATPENVNTMLAFQDYLAQMVDKVKERFKPEAVEETLRQMQATMPQLLPGPVGEPQEGHHVKTKQ